MNLSQKIAAWTLYKIVTFCIGSWLLKCCPSVLCLQCNWCVRIPVCVCATFDVFSPICWCKITCELHCWNEWNQLVDMMKPCRQLCFKYGVTVTQIYWQWDFSVCGVVMFCFNSDMSLVQEVVSACLQSDLFCVVGDVKLLHDTNCLVYAEQLMDSQLKLAHRTTSRKIAMKWKQKLPTYSVTRIIGAGE